MNPIVDLVCILLEKPFRFWKEVDKEDLINIERPTPKISRLNSENRTGKTRSFNCSLYASYSWLCGSTYKETLFCWPCLLFGTKERSIWTTTGYADFKNISRSVKQHENNRVHLNSFASFKRLKKNSRCSLELLKLQEDELKIKYNAKVRLNRLFMKHLIDIIIFLEKQELASTGHDENLASIKRENVNELFRLLTDRCVPELKLYLTDIKPIFYKYSNSIQNGILTCIHEYITEHIKNEINSAPFFSLQVDDTTDLAEICQCSIIIRFVNPQGELIERFVGFHDIDENRDVISMFSLLVSFLNQFNYQTKLIGQSYDGVSVTTGNLNGLQSRVRAIAPHAIFTHCCAHRLNLILEQACSLNPKCRIFFATLTGIASFFHRSPKRYLILSEIVNRRKAQMADSRPTILSLIASEYEHFRFLFEKIANDSTSNVESINEANCYFKHLSDFEFAFLTLVFNDLFGETEILFSLLQKHNLDIEYCFSKIKDTSAAILLKRSEEHFFIFFDAALSFCRPQNDDLLKLRYHLLYHEIVDVLLDQLNIRFADLEKYTFLKLGDVSKFQDYNEKFPLDAFQNLKTTFPDLFDYSKLLKELQFIYSDSQFFRLPNVQKVLTSFTENDLADVLPQAFNFFSLILTIPFTRISVERSFYCLKRVKTFLRKTLSQDRIKLLGVLSIEKELLAQLKSHPEFYDDIINKFAALKESEHWDFDFVLLMTS